MNQTVMTEILDKHGRKVAKNDKINVHLCGIVHKGIFKFSLSKTTAVVKLLDAPGEEIALRKILRKHIEK